MAEAIAGNQYFDFIKGDVPEGVVDAVLGCERRQDLFLRMSQTLWDDLEAHKPNLADAMRMICHEYSRGDPVLAEEMAGAMLSLCALFSATHSREKLEPLLTNSGLEAIPGQPQSTTDVETGDDGVSQPPAA